MIGVLNRVREWFHVTGSDSSEEITDYRFSLANERTYLAWIRTSLALIAGGLAVAAFLPANWPTTLRTILAVSLIALGAVLAVRAVDRWARTETAMRKGEPLPVSRFPAGVAVLIACGAVVIAVVVVVFT